MRLRSLRIFVKLRIGGMRLGPTLGGPNARKHHAAEANLGRFDFRSGGAELARPRVVDNAGQQLCNRANRAREQLGSRTNTTASLKRAYLDRVAERHARSIVVTAYVKKACGSLCA